MEGDEAYDISDTMITNESQARTLEHGPTQTQAAYQLGTSACIQESQIRAAVIWIREHPGVWKNLGKAY